MQFDSCYFIAQVTTAVDRYVATFFDETCPAPISDNIQFYNTCEMNS
jgi:hypothetical protein